MAGGRESVTFEIVCTGNICRSPFIDAILTDALDAIAPGAFVVRSSGTHALRGSSPHPETRARLRLRDLSLRGYRAAQVTPARLMAADVILVMDKEQRQQVIDEEPGAARRVFLVKELARLIRVLGAEQPWDARIPGAAALSARDRWRAIVRVAAANRERLRHDDDILADPYQQGVEAFAQMDVEASDAVEALVGLERELRRGTLVP